MSEERKSLEEMKAAVLARYPKARFAETAVGRAWQIVTTRKNHLWRLEAISSSFDSASEDEAWADAFAKLPSPESETAGGESSKAPCPDCLVVDGKAYCDMNCGPCIPVAPDPLGIEAARRIAKGHAKLTQDLIKPPTQPICGVIGRKDLPCGLKAYDHAGKHCAFGPDGEPVEFWARGTVVPGELPVEQSREEWRALTNQELALGQIPKVMRCADCKTKEGFHAATCKDARHYEVPVEAHPVITQDEKLDVEDLIMKQVGYGQPVSGPATIQLMPLLVELLKLRKRVAELLEDRDSPETEDFFKGVPLEAAHQRGRWPSEQDAGKAPADWFWLVGYLAGKCLTAHIAGNREKALHHTISTAAALANWHMSIKGISDMRPGIETPVEAAELLNEKGTNNG